MANAQVADDRWTNLCMFFVQLDLFTNASAALGHLLLALWHFPSRRSSHITAYCLISLVICTFVPSFGVFLLPGRVRDYPLGYLFGFICAGVCALTLANSLSSDDPMVMLSILLS
ncbi:hypothetical protein EDD22DRAFT_890267 [Suillus occidentalis]|nr:hypothetical protein EDD22DRAFT_890267 [Suillus occidentalis]